MSKNDTIIDFIRNCYNTQDFIPLHEPKFTGNEKNYLKKCVDSTFVSSVGEFVDKFEKDFAEYTSAKYAIATVNGTAAIHIALLLSGVERDDEVITQPLTFVATCNAISYVGGIPVFIDVDKETLGLSPEKLRHFLEKNTKIDNRGCVNKITGRRIKAVVPMHTFGHPAKIDELKQLCKAYKLNLIEDSAESLGSFYNNKHTGTFGLFGTFSFNGNKTITTGGGGMIITDNKALAAKAKHLTTTAKVPHPWEFRHDSIGFNYRLPNINAALGCAQLESLTQYLKLKRELAEEYASFFKNLDIHFFTEPEKSSSNYWLNAIILKNETERNSFLDATNKTGVMTRPIWKLMNHLPMFRNAQIGNLENAIWLEQRVVNIPSSARI
ncbi:MAG: LegC family aminotransferase [Bacteroidota bacterium]